MTTETDRIAALRQTIFTALTATTVEEMKRTLLAGVGSDFSTPKPPMTLAEAVKANILIDAKGRERFPGEDPRTGKYSTAQMLRDEFYGGDTSQPLDD